SSPNPKKPSCSSAPRSPVHSAPPKGRTAPPSLLDYIGHIQYRRESSRDFEKSAKLQVTLRGQEVLNHQTAGREHHLPSRADQFLANRTRDMRFPRAGVPENEHILMSLYEASFQQGPDLLSRLRRQPLQVQGRQTLLHEQPRFP